MFHDKHRTRHGAAHRDDGVTAAARPAVSGDDAVDDLLRTLRDERGFAFATLQNHRRGGVTPAAACQLCGPHG